MSTSKLGRSEDLDKYWSEELVDQSEDKIQIDSINRQNIHPLPEFPEYPYTSQLRIFGQFSFGSPGRKRDWVYRKGIYEYRTASGLFLVDTKTDKPTAKEVFSEINRHVSNSAKIEDALSIDRGALWRFLEKANSIENLIVRGPEGTYDVVLLADILQEESPSQKIKQIDLPKEEYREVIKNIIHKINIPDQVKDIRDIDIDWENTVIDHAEATFWYNKELIPFRFNRGTLEVGNTKEMNEFANQKENEKDIPREYVLQLFESEVIYPSTI